MSSVGIALVILLGALACLFMLILCLPLAYRGACRYRGPFSYSVVASQFPLWTMSVRGEEDSSRAKLRVLGVPLALSLDQSETEEEGDHPPADCPQKKASWRSTLDFGSILDREVCGAMFRLVRGLLRLLRPRHLSIRGRVGPGEPHLAGYLYALRGMASAWGWHWCSEVEPVWDEEVVDITGEAAGRFIPGVLLLHLFRFLLSRPGMRMLKRAWQSR